MTSPVQMCGGRPVTYENYVAIPRPTPESLCSAIRARDGKKMQEIATQLADYPDAKRTSFLQAALDYALSNDLQEVAQNLCEFLFDRMPPSHSTASVAPSSTPKPESEVRKIYKPEQWKDFTVSLDKSEFSISGAELQKTLKKLVLPDFVATRLSDQFGNDEQLGIFAAIKLVMDEIVNNRDFDITHTHEKLPKVAGIFLEAMSDLIAISQGQKEVASNCLENFCQVPEILSDIQGEYFGYYLVQLSQVEERINQLMMQNTIDPLEPKAEPTAQDKAQAAEKVKKQIQIGKGVLRQALQLLEGSNMGIRITPLPLKK